MADVTSISRQVNELENRLDVQIAKAKRSQTTTIIIGVVLIIIIIVYFTVLSSYVRDLSKPDEVAGMASATLQEKIAELKPELEKSIKEEGPKMVDSLVDSAINEHIPQFRKDAEAAIIEESDRQFDRMAEVIITSFDDVVENHGERIRTFSEELQTSEGRDGFEEFVYKTLVEAMEEQDILINIESYGDALVNVDTMLAHLMEEDAELTPHEQATFDLVAVIREMANRSTLSLKDLPSVSGLEEALNSRAISDQ